MFHLWKSKTCEIEKKTNHKADKILGFCKGIPYSYTHSYADGRSYAKMELYSKCMLCNKCLERKVYSVFFESAFIIILLLFTLIFATPQGAIKRQLLIQEGIFEAITSTIEKEDIANSKPMSEYYSVMVNDREKKWRVDYFSHACVAECLQSDF